MKWFQKILSVVALVQMVLSPSAFAQWTKKEQAQIAQYRGVLEPMGYELKLDPANKRAAVFQKGGGNMVMEIPFSEESRLRKFSPKTLNEMMLKEMVRVKSASGASWSQTVRALPTESAVFFLAMGAVVAGQLITNYAQNPVAMKQHVDHSLSPIGVFGFFTFMYSQGVTSNVLAMYMKNPKFHHMIPYLGMTVGAFLQTYLSQVASDPNVMACARTMMGYKLSEKDLAAGADEDPCGKAYEYLVVNKKIWEFAPGILSMLISAGLAGVTQSLVTKAVLKITGVDIALWLVPGGMQLKGMRLLLVKGLQMTAFVGIDAWLNRNVTMAWKNMYDGADFYNQNDRLNNYMNEMRRTRWSGDEKPLIAEVKDFREKMTNWRMMNMSEVYESHQAWQEQLHQLLSMYNSSYAFYNSMITEIRNVRFDESPNKPLLEKAPLTGISAKDLTEGKEDLYLLNPQFVSGMQLETVKDAATLIDSLLAEGQDQGLYPRELKALQNAAVNFRSENEAKIGESIQELKKLKEEAEAGFNSSIDFHRNVSLIFEKLGNPTPPMGVGQGYLANYEKAPSTADTLKGTNYYRVVGAYETPKITDYLVMQMLCGPDLNKGESVIRNSLGYPSVFLPPTVIDDKDYLLPCNGLGLNLPVAHLYSSPLQNTQGKYHNGAIPYLVAEARGEVVGSKDKMAFDDWWKNRTEAQILQAFESYTKSYDEIVAKLVKAIYYSGRSFFNGREVNPLKAVDFMTSETARERFFSGGPVMNGGMNSAFQEERVYLSLLEELMAPTGNAFKMNIGTILAKNPTHPALKDVDNQFAALNGLIRQVKVVQQDGREVIKSDVENYQLEEQLQKIQASLTTVSTLLGVGDETEGAQYKLNEKQTELAVTILEQLQSLATEVMMYGSMANAVSWEKIRDIKRLNLEQQQYNNQIQKALSQMRGAGVPGAR